MTNSSYREFSGSSGEACRRSQPQVPTADVCAAPRICVAGQDTSTCSPRHAATIQYFRCHLVAGDSRNDRPIRKASPTLLTARPELRLRSMPKTTDTGARWRRRARYARLWDVTAGRLQETQEAPKARMPSLQGLARSLGSELEPRLTEPPVVEEMPAVCTAYAQASGAWPLLALQDGEASHACLPGAGSCALYTLALLQNAHHTPMHPLEEISALCISRLLANLDARHDGR